jgi:hypothetical protein
MLEPDPEKYSSHNSTREQGASALLTFTEVKVNLLCVKGR